MKYEGSNLKNRREPTEMVWSYGKNKGNKFNKVYKSRSSKKRDSRITIRRQEKCGKNGEAYRDLLYTCQFPPMPYIHENRYAYELNECHQSL